MVKVAFAYKSGCIKNIPIHKDNVIKTFEKGWENLSDAIIAQFVIFNPPSYCFEGAIGFNVKAS